MTDLDTDDLATLDDEVLGACPVDPHHVLACFRTAVEFWHELIDFEVDTWAVDESAPQYDTARDYFHARGFTDEDIDRFQFGWAPGGTALYDHLRDHGFTDEEMLWTGVFSRAGNTHHPSVARPGRVVIPYHVDDEPVYAIFRTTGRKGGGHPDPGYDGHPCDIQEGKYSKPRSPSPDNRSVLDEPAWGVDYINEDQPLVITEGVLDAAQAVSQGYSAISPVTTSFSARQKDQFVSLVEDAHEVWIINDNDSPPGDNLYEEPLAPVQRG